MARPDASQQSSAPPSPICSDTISLPDATSDLDNLSDYSGLSVSDEDEKHSRSNTESEAEQFSDGDFDEITHSMLASTDLRSHAQSSSKDQSTSTSRLDTADYENTPSASINRTPRHTSFLNRRISARDLTYPTLSHPDTDNLFGLNLNAIYKQIEQERAISQDEDLYSYSILDAEGQSFRQKYERSIQTEPEHGTIDDSADTLSGLAHSTAVEFEGEEEGEESPLFSGGWPEDAGAAQAESPSIEGNTAAPLVDEEEVDGISLQANWQRCGPRWLNKQTFGIFGVVLLGVVAYHVKSAPWLSADTSALFLNTSGIVVSDSSTTLILTTMDIPIQKVAVATVPPASTGDTAAGPSSTHQPLHDRLSVSDHESSTSDLISTHSRAALSSLPSSVSALISMASSGIASLSTHVASASNLGHCSKHNQFQAIVASRQRGHRCSRGNRGDSVAITPSSQTRSAGLFSHGGTALSALPRRAQRGLSMLTQRASSDAGGKFGRGMHDKQQKKKQVSRRTGKHWIDKNAPEVPKKPLDIHASDNSLIKEDLQRPKSDKAVRAPFSRLSAPVFRNNEVHMHDQGEESGSPSASANGQRLLLDIASALSSFSFGNLCKQLDGLLLPYTQHMVDTLDRLDYATVWTWLTNTMNECYQIMAPYVATVDGFSNKHVTEWSEEAKKAASNSIVQLETIYDNTQAYLQRAQIAYMPIIQQYKATAQKKVQDVTHLAESVSRKSAKKAYGHSKMTFSKASKNARRILRRNDFTRYQHKKHKKVGCA